MMVTKNIVVVVCYKEREILRSLILRLFKNIEVEHIVIVDTSKDFFFDNTMVQQKYLNELGEFTGYQYGLSAAVATCASNDNVRCFIMNDTIFSSHLTFLFRMLVVRLTRLNVSVLNVSGLVEGRAVGKIIPSCFFVLAGTVKELSGIKLYRVSGVDLFEKVKGMPQFNDLFFQSRLKLWLRPTNFLKGWYKAPFFSSLDKNTYNRKAVAICLEWDMINYLTEQGVTLKDSSDNRFVKALKLLDRFFCNYLKLKFRLTEFVVVKILKRKSL